MNVLCSVFSVLTFAQINALTNPVVYTSLGSIQGVEEKTEELGKTIYSFLGIPYAQPPIGELRFEAPRPVKKWGGRWIARENAAVCPQPNNEVPQSITGEEDCLYLNIYTPSLSNSSLLPVMVFFHDGAFTHGSGNSKTPYFILDKADFLYITVNYRLGPLGFFSTGDSVVPGNNGLKDQSLSLKWIQEHIAAFGGNKEDVTIVGFCAGAASVHLHYLSPQSKNLFKKGVSISGSAFSPWVLTENAPQKAKQLAASVGCTTEDSHEMVQCLKQRPSRKFLSQVKSLFWPFLINPITPFGVVIEKSGDDSFLIDHPYKLVSEGRVADVPWLVSGTFDPGLYPAAAFIKKEEHLKTLNDDWLNIAPHLLDYNFTIPAEKLDEVGNKIREFYFGKEEISRNTKDKVVKMIGDRFFVVDTVRAAKLQSAVVRSPIYYYYFDYKNKHDLAKELANIWLSFLVSSKPSLPQDIKWDPVDSQEDFTYLLINSTDNIHQETSANLGNSEFWDSLNFNELNYNKRQRNEL